MSQPTVAYFSAEYAPADDLPIYAGGLGILAADTVAQAGVDGRDFAAIGLMYHGAFTGHDAGGRPLTERLQAAGFSLLQSDGAALTVTVMVADRTVALRVWCRAYGTARLYLLDARTDPNHLRDRAISDKLYAPEPELAFAQEVILGFGGLALIRQLGLDIGVFHLNEGHTAPAALALAVEWAQAHPGVSFADALSAVRADMRATKHTILSAAGLTLAPTVVEHVLGPTLARAGWTVADVMAVAGKPSGQYSDTKLLLAAAAKSSGVSRIHVAAEAAAHAGSPLVALTNGVFAPRWQNPAPEAASDPIMAHHRGKEALLDYVCTETGTGLDPNALTVVWARRMTAYKRPSLLVSDLARLGRLAIDPDRPVQFIVAGQANPADAEGVRLMNDVIAATDDPRLAGRLAYLPGYNPYSARLLVQGADLWLNTPVRGQEACGTSGMKASLNGAVQFSTADGWVDEVEISRIGWRLADQDSADSLYGTLERDIAPLYYDDRDAWNELMRANIELIKQAFTTERMLRDYYGQLYA